MNTDGCVAEAEARLRVDRLSVTYRNGVRALDQMSLVLQRGCCLCVLGESGSGKSTLARALLGLLADADVSGSIELDGRLVTAPGDWERARWRQIAIVLPSTSALNPVLSVGLQIAEPARVHGRLSARAAGTRAGSLLEVVGLGAWAAERYPHQLSTGQRRLVMIAIALACDAPILILDEPTSGLDPETRLAVLSLLSRLKERGRSLLVLTHDVVAAHALADEVAIMYRGWLAERGRSGAVLRDPRHPYSFGLLNASPTLGSVKDLRGIRGQPPDPSEVFTGCPFASRCTQPVLICEQQRPPQTIVAGPEPGRMVACHRGGRVTALELRSVTKTYVLGGRLRGQRVQALAGVDLTVRESEVVGVVGRNAAGKSTLAQVAAHLLDPDSGDVLLEDTALHRLGPAELRRMRTRVQMLYPDPVAAVSPRATVLQIVREPLDVQRTGEPAWRDDEVRRLLEQVRLPARLVMERRAHELSTGQLQRVALARALALRPKVLVADEPVECLDPSERANVLQLLKAIQVETGMSMLVVSHDLAVVARVADRVIVMDGGRIVEEAPSSELLRHPCHPVTRRLLEASGAELPPYRVTATYAEADPDDREALPWCDVSV